MPLDLQSPLSGGSMTAWAAVYTAISLYVTGPLVGERTIERLGWMEGCTRALTQHSTSSAPTTTPLTCQTLLGWMGDEAATLCQHYGNPALPDMSGLAGRAKQRGADAERWLGLRETSGSRCRCAINLTLSRERTAFALYAGSARMIAPAPVRTLTQVLETSLNSAPCAGRSERGVTP